MVGGGLLDVALLGEFGSADDVAAAHDDGELDAHGVGLFDLACDVIKLVGLDAKAAGLAEGLAGDLEKDAVEFGHGGVCGGKGVVCGGERVGRWGVLG